MKKKITIGLVLILVMTAILSVTAHAADLPQATQSGGTTISITDITPREDGENEKQKAENYTVGSYYPIEVETAEDHGIQLLVKTFLVPSYTDPQTLIQTDLIRRGIAYEPTDILRQEIAGEDEKKTVSQTVTMESETDDLDDILSLLGATMDYREDGFTGTLTLDKSSIRTKESGSSSYAYQMKETREFNNLDRNDLAYIPKTVEKNGVTLSLADVNWIPMASGADNSEVPSLYKAEATYTGTAYGSKADGYTVTAEYTGEVSRAAEGQVIYRIVYEEIPLMEKSAGFSFPWKTVGLVMLGIVILAGIGTGIFFLVRFIKDRKPRERKVQRERSYQQDPYADRPRMHRPEMLRAMDRGMEDE